MIRTFYITTALAAALSFGGPAFAQDTTPAPQSPPEGQTDQSEEDWRNQNKTTSKKIEDIINPNPNSGGNGWGVTLPPLDDMDQLPAESAKHLKRERNKVIGKMDMKTGEMGNTDYKPSPAAEDDPSLQAEEKSVWDKMIDDLKGAAKGRAGSSPGKAGEKTGQGSGGQATPGQGSGGGQQTVENSQGSSSGGPAPTSIFGRIGRKSASDMMRSGNPGSVGTQPTPQPEPVKVAERGSIPQNMPIGMPSSQGQGQPQAPAQTPADQTESGRPASQSPQGDQSGTETPKSVLPQSSSGSASDALGQTQTQASGPQSGNQDTQQPSSEQAVTQSQTQPESAGSSSEQSSSSPQQAKNQSASQNTATNPSSQQGSPQSPDPSSGQPPQDPSSSPQKPQQKSAAKPNFLSALLKAIGLSKPSVPNVPTVPKPQSPQQSEPVSAPAPQPPETTPVNSNGAAPQSEPPTELSAENTLPSAPTPGADSASEPIAERNVETSGASESSAPQPTFPRSPTPPAEIPESLEDLIEMTEGPDDSDFDALEELIKLTEPVVQK